ncbi:hypothetical protein HUN21_19190, partial [Acinetobacter oleivorans]|nr:hypothetical protein [Acinetobacter oleivorans]
MKEKLIANKELRNKLISVFLILLSICLCVALLIILKYGESCPEVIVGMLGVCATLYAPIAAFYLIDTWKEQVQHERALDLLIEVRSSFSMLHRAIMRLKLKDQYVVLYNIYQHKDFRKLLRVKIDEFSNEVDSLTVALDDLDKIIKGLYLVTGCE